MLRVGALVLLALLVCAAPAAADPGEEPERKVIRGLLRPGRDGVRAQPDDAQLIAAVSDATLDPWLLVSHCGTSSANGIISFL